MQPATLFLFFGTCLTIAAILNRGGEVRPKKTSVRARVVLEGHEAARPGAS